MHNSNPYGPVVFVVGVFVAVLLINQLECGTDPDLARTAHESVQLARDAQERDTSAVLWSGRLRLLALAIGVSAPLIVAYLIQRAVTRSAPDSPDVLAEAERLRLLQLGPPRTDVHPALPHDATKPHLPSDR